MKKYGSVCECGNIKDTLNKFCNECRDLEERNKINKMRQMTCHNKSPKIKFLKGIKLSGGLGWKLTQLKNQ